MQVEELYEMNSNWRKDTVLELRKEDNCELLAQGTYRELKNCRNEEVSMFCDNTIYISQKSADEQKYKLGKMIDDIRRRKKDTGRRLNEEQR